MVEEFESDMPTKAYIGGSSLRRSSTPERLRNKKQQLEEELKNVNAALEFLDKNPEFERALHLISVALS